MTYKLHALPIWEKGNYRGNQEDAIFPPMGLVTDDARLFMVCDGMGGHEAGEVASGAVIEAMTQRILQDSAPDGPFPDELLSQAFSDAYDLLDERDPHPESIKRMGTTIALLKFHADGATVAHIGDSRIYQFRKIDDKMRVIFKSIDHSLVNDLIKVGEMTEEEARTSPLKNRITRAMQSHLDSRPKADVKHLADIQPGDYFYLCSDGMLENADDDNLCFIFGHACSDEDKVKMLIGNSEDNHDNHSGMVVHILSTDAQEDSGKVQTPPTKDTAPAPPIDVPRKKHYTWYYAIVLALIALCALLLPRWCKSHPLSQNKEEHQKEQTRVDVTRTTPVRVSSPKTPAKRPAKPVKPAKSGKPVKPASGTPSQPPLPSSASPSHPAIPTSPHPTSSPEAAHQPMHADVEAVSNETRGDEALDAYNNRRN